MDSIKERQELFEPLPFLFSPYEKTVTLLPVRPQHLTRHGTGMLGVLVQDFAIHDSVDHAVGWHNQTTATTWQVVAHLRSLG
jgi:hypothetical protein